MIFRWGLLLSALLSLAMSVFNLFFFYRVYKSTKSEGAALLSLTALLIAVASCLYVIEATGSRSISPLTIDLMRGGVVIVGFVAAVLQTSLLIWNPKWLRKK